MKKIFINDTTVLFGVISVIMIVYINVYLQVKQMSELAVSTSQFSGPVLQYKDGGGEEVPYLNFSEVVADNNKCCIQVFGVDPEAEVDGAEGCELMFYLENRSNTRLDFNTTIKGINGLYLTDSITPTLDAGKSKIAEMFIDKKFLNLYGTDTEKFTDLEFEFKVYNGEDPYYVQKAEEEAKEAEKTAEDTNGKEDKNKKDAPSEETTEKAAETVSAEESAELPMPADAFAGTKHFYPYGKEEAVNFAKVRGTQPDDKVLLDNEEVTVTAVDYAAKKDGTRIDLLTENKTDKDIALEYDEIYVNGQKIEGGSALINTYAGKSSFVSYTLPASVMEENGIDKIEKIELAVGKDEGSDKTEKDEDGEKDEKGEESDKSAELEEAAEEEAESINLVYIPEDKKTDKKADKKAAEKEDK